MAHRIATADGNWTTAATWGVVDATSLLDSQANNTLLTTSYAGAASGVTPGAITIDGIAVKVASRAASPSGTMSVQLYNITDAGAVAGTEVTINVSDLPAGQGTPSSTFNQCSIGWTFFKFAAPVTLIAGKSYRVEAKTSAATQVNLFRDATTSNWSRLWRTTTTGAPAAGDSLFVLGEWTAAGTKTNRAVTMNETATTDYGSASTTLASVGISKGGTLAYGTAASTNYVLRLSGLLQVWMDGIFTMGTTGTPVPATSTASLEFDQGATGDFGLIGFGTVTIQGSPRTAGKLVTYALLTADLSLGGTTVNVDRDTGWKSGDEVAITSTTQTRDQGEVVTLTGDAGASSFGTGAAAAAHGGSASSGIQAEAMLLTQNVRLYSTNSARGFYCYVAECGTWDIDWASFQYLFGTSTKTGLYCLASIGLNYCTFKNATTNTMIALEANVAQAWSHLNFWSSTGIFIDYDDGALTLTDCVFCHDGTTNIAAVNVGPSTANGQSVVTLTRCYFSGTAGASVVTALGTVASTEVIKLTMTDCVCHSSGGSASPLTLGAGFQWVRLDGCRFWHNVAVNASGGINFNADGYTIRFAAIDCWFLGNGHAAVRTSMDTNLTALFRGCVFAGTTSVAQSRAWDLQGSEVSGTIRFENCTFGVVEGIRVAHTADFDWVSGSFGADLIFVNSRLASATRFSANFLAALKAGVLIAEQRQDGTTDTHQRLITKMGTISYETTVFKTAAPSEKLTLDAAGFADAQWPLCSSRKRVAVRSGQAVTLSVWVRKTGAYAGSAAKLVVAANPALGLDDDLVLDTMTAGADTWEQLTGTTTPVAEENGVLECYVAVDGAAGAVYVDDWSVEEV